MRATPEWDFPPSWFCIYPWRKNFAIKNNDTTLKGLMLVCTYKSGYTARQVNFIICSQQQKTFNQHTLSLNTSWKKSKKWQQILAISLRITIVITSGLFKRPILCFAGLFLSCFAIDELFREWCIQEGVQTDVWNMGIIYRYTSNHL